LIGRSLLVGIATLALAACDSKPLPSPAAETPGVGDTSGDAGASGARAEGGASTGGAVTGGEPTRLAVLEQARIVSDQAADNFQRASAGVDFGSEPVRRAALRVTLESPCFPFAKWADPGVPSGQRWPAACDAFDRTLSVTLDEPEPGTAGPPAIELLHAVTPFGGPLTVEADVTDVVNGLPGQHQLSVHIDTFSDADGLVSGSQGEWIASAELALFPGEAPRHVLAVVPLIFEAQTEPDPAPVSFEVPPGAGNARIEYRVTGHGQAVSPDCFGPAEEFCQRTHELRLDGALLTELLPWRDDCSELCTLTSNDSGFGPRSYCAENPCGDPNSVRAPRANWCPGSASPPFILDSTSLTRAGTHELSRSIPALAPGGIWAVSATYFAFE
jgi:hypothetical protein